MKELIEFAKEKGFKSEHIFPYTFPNSGIVDSESFYLWMCELQKWLRDKHRKDVLVNTWNMDKDESSYHWHIEWFNKSHKLKSHNIELKYSSYEQALEKGLFEALKLIK